MSLGAFPIAANCIQLVLPSNLCELPPSRASSRTCAPTIFSHMTVYRIGARHGAHVVQQRTCIAT
eukprot:11117505-Alexandrium_andersonii.AAC.1